MLRNRSFDFTSNNGTLLVGHSWYTEFSKIKGPRGQISTCNLWDSVTSGILEIVKFLWFAISSVHHC